MSALRVGVVGVGRMGQRHCRVYSNLRRARFVGIHDLDPRRAAEVASRFEVPAFDRLDELLERVDAVTLAAPTGVHATLGLECLARGVHLLVEKPIATSCDEAERLVAAAAARSLVLQVGHIERFNAAYIELKAVLEDLTPLAIDLRRLSPPESSNRGIDVVHDLMIHDTNLALDLMGSEPVSVGARGISVFTDAVDHAVAQLRFPSGALFTMTASRVTQQKVRSLDVTAREAFVECDLLKKSLEVHRGTTGVYLGHREHGMKYRQESRVENIHVPTYEPLFSQLEHFVACVLDKVPCIVSGGEGLRALRLAEAIRACLEVRAVGRAVAGGMK